MSLLTIKDGNVSVSEEYLKKGSFIHDIYHADHSRGHESFNKMVKYLYHVYDKRSDFHDIKIKDRRIIVAKDMLQDETYPEKIEVVEDFEKMVSLLNKQQFTKDENLLESVNRKIDEYNEMMDGMTIDPKNPQEFLDFAAGSETLLKLKERLQRIVLKEAAQKQVGGGDSTMFEND